MKYSIPIFLFVLFTISLFGQSWQGNWVGTLTQDGKTDEFIYSVSLEQEESKVFGTATSESSNGGNNAKFEIGGIWDGNILTLQEVKQLEPPNARWCLKHIRLLPVNESGTIILSGTWEAEGCTPGRLELRPEHASSSIITPSGDPDIIENQHTIFGKYTGTLSQSDRDYGFYFELWLNENGTGRSKITSDGEGGNAEHQLLWTFDKKEDRLFFEELKVVDRSIADWPWCLKTATLDFTKEQNRLSLSGNWKGYIEGFDTETGACAPGKVYLERPIFRKEDLVLPKNEIQQIKSLVPQGVQNYVHQKKREVQVDRVLEVKSETVRVRVWDNGIIDGDVLTLFVNGEKILENYRVTRRKHETIIKLDKPTNYLILHAINLGSISPNTVAVSVDDGFEEQVVIMSSNLDKSGAIMIKQFTVGEK